MTWHSEHPKAHIQPEHAQIFFSLYFVMTGIHALHMVVGVGIFLWLIYKAWKGRLWAEILHAG